MKRIIILLSVSILSAGCAFKSIDSCGAEGAGAGCTPVMTNLENVLEGNNNNNTSTAVTPDFSMIDMSVLKSEYGKVSTNSNYPTPLSANKVKIRVFPYADGERFYDARDIYVIIQKAGWVKGSVVYTNNKGIVALNEENKKLPEKLEVIASKLHMREAPNVNFNVLAVLENGNILTPLGYRDGWYKVEYNGIIGWVNGGYLR